MLVFPQLSSGANVQYPLSRVDTSRTVINLLEDGSTLKFQDVSAGRTSWTLRLNSLDEAERLAVEQLFIATEGELKPFTLLDPSSNLLSWSEDLSKSAWVSDPLLQKVSGSADPLGGTAGWQLTNASQASQGIGQSIVGPAGFEYCFSVFLKGPGTAGLVRSSGATSTTLVFELSANWQRVSSAGALGGAGVTVDTSIVLEPGATIQVFGPQLEAQPAAGPYRRSLGVSGVAQVRFDSPRLATEAVGLDRNNSVIHLVSVE